MGILFNAYSANGLVEVPQTLKIGNLKLTITKGARRQIQTQIYRLLRNSQNFNENLERLKTYAPLIEEVLRDENLPIDFKYLPLLESKLIATTKNSFEEVGFWQLKEDLAKSYGLKINDKVDERMNLVASTRAASRLLRKNNLYFKNWIYTILTIDVGFSQAKQHILNNYNKREVIGVQEIYIEERTHSFIKKFLAYKIAFEEKAALSTMPVVQLMNYSVSGKTLHQIGRKFKVSTDLMKLYNPWLKRKRIPRDKAYEVIIPLQNEQSPGKIAKVDPNKLIEPTKKNTTDKKEARLKPKFHEETKKKSLAVTPSLPKPEIVIKSIEDDKKKYPNISKKETGKEETKTTETTKVIVPKMVIKDGEDNPINYEVVKTTETPRVQQNEEDNPLPKVENEVKEFTTINNDPVPDNVEGRNDYNTTSGKFFPKDLEPRHNDQFINPNTPKAGIHVVAKGQNVFDIARRYNISVSDLRKWNYINHDVYVGQKLVVAPPKEIANQANKQEQQVATNSEKARQAPFEKQKTLNFNRSRYVTTKTRTYVHVVIRGQSLENIATAYRVNAEDIKDWNNLRSNVIHMGQKLVIFKVFRLLQHASPIVKGQFFRDRRETNLRNKLMNHQSKSLRKVMNIPAVTGD
ncbi:hypothetical protein BKI52_19670 [marine bacterium AO1-C]|nr:hypothetical protein BKI52_19670 [marine bacterium AO1-C]